jgi:hypothetical protein
MTVSILLKSTCMSHLCRSRIACVDGHRHSHSSPLILSSLCVPKNLNPHVGDARYLKAHPASKKAGCYVIYSEDGSSGAALTGNSIDNESAVSSGSVWGSPTISGRAAFGPCSGGHRKRTFFRPPTFEFPPRSSSNKRPGRPGPPSQDRYSSVRHKQNSSRVRRCGLGHL